jgi:hypothetical protein
MVMKTQHEVGGHEVYEPFMRYVMRYLWAGGVINRRGEPRVRPESPHRALDAAHEMWRLPPRRGQESLCTHDQGGHRRLGLSVATRIKLLPHWGHRGPSRAGVGSVPSGG